MVEKKKKDNDKEIELCELWDIIAKADSTDTYTLSTELVYKKCKY